MLRPSRHVRAGVRHPRDVGDAISSTSLRAISTAPAASCSPNPAAPIDAALPKGKGFAIGRWMSRVSGQPVVERADPVVHDGRGDTHARRRTSAGDDSADDQPGAQRRQFHAARGGILSSRFSRRDRFPHQRDDASRAPHSPDAVTAPSWPSYELGFYHALRPQRDQVVTGRSVPLPPETPETWQVLANLGALLMGLTADRLCKPSTISFFAYIRRAALVGDDGPWPGLTVDEVVEKVGGAIGPERARRHVVAPRAIRAALAAGRAA